MLEIELKANIKDAEAFKAEILKQGFHKEGVRIEADTYYNGVDRDFAKTDEALRVRLVEDANTGEKQAAITYKGPKLDPLSRTRQEHEVQVSDSAGIHALLQALGYRPVREVYKKREYYKKWDITACVDDVRGLGSYMELEIVAEEDACRDTALARLFHVLQFCGVSKEACTRKSYLEMLLEKDQNTP